MPRPPPGPGISSHLDSCADELGGEVIVDVNVRLANWSHHAETAIKDHHIPVQRIGLPDLEASRVDSSFSVLPTAP